MEIKQSTINTGVVTFNTNDSLTQPTVSPIQEIPTFQLVPETDPILGEVLPWFDFINPPFVPANFASSMVETCKREHGVGLSANQCGYRVRMFVMGFGDNYVAMFNPIKIAESAESIHMVEGCLSFPLLGIRITRPKTVTISYQDYTGESRQVTLEGISARCALHELDHLDGITFVQVAKPLALKSAIGKRTKILHKMMRQYRTNTLPNMPVN
jgi:peptide deformylase